jgi:hypothetical protein
MNPLSMEEKKRITADAFMNVNELIRLVENAAKK